MPCPLQQRREIQRPALHPAGRMPTEPQNCADFEHSGADSIDARRARRRWELNIRISRANATPQSLGNDFPQTSDSASGRSCEMADFTFFSKSIDARTARSVARRNSESRGSWGEPKSLRKTFVLPASGAAVLVNFYSQRSELQLTARPRVRQPFRLPDAPGWCNSSVTAPRERHPLLPSTGALPKLLITLRTVAQLEFAGPN